MTIDKALELVQWYYQLALQKNKEYNRPVILNPVAWALHKAWVDADKEKNNVRSV